MSTRHVSRRTAERAERRTQQRRRASQPRRWWQGPYLIGGAAAAIVIIVIAFFVISGRSLPSNVPTGADLDAITSELTHISPDVYNAVGTGGLTSPLKAISNAQPLTSGGKPEVLYIGAEFCPYCASERWSLIAALSRFGEFQGLKATQSKSEDVYPNTPTFSFYHSQYSSPTVEFAPVETKTREQAPLQKPSPEQDSLMQTYNPGGSIPFIDIGNRYYIVGSGYDTGLVNGKSWQQIASALSNPNDPITKAIVGNANYLTAAICQATGSQPEDVCHSDGVAAVVNQLTQSGG